jgi:hypothetical protein
MLVYFSSSSTIIPLSLTILVVESAGPIDRVYQHVRDTCSTLKLFVLTILVLSQLLNYLRQLCLRPHRVTPGPSPAGGVVITRFTPRGVEGVELIL